MTDQQNDKNAALSDPHVAAALAEQQAAFDARTHAALIRTATEQHLTDKADQIRTTLETQPIPLRAYLGLAATTLLAALLVWLILV